MLILAGITISYVMGDNSVFKKASEAKLKADIAQWQERLELAKSPVFIEGLGTFNSDKYFGYIQGQGIINNKDTDVIDNGDGTYEVTTKPGYVFLVTLVPTPENPTDAEIEYIGQAGKLPPRVKSIKVTGKTGTSIDIEVEVIRLEDGKLSYYYKESEEPDSAYKEVKKEVTDLTATIGSLTDGKIYDIKVVVKNKNGENELVIKEAIQQLVKTITLDKPTARLKPNATIQLNATIMPENAENKTLEWSSDNETVATVDNNGLVTAKANGNVIITVKATDGGEVQATCNITVKIPVESITLNKTNERVEPNETVTLIATIMPTNATNKNVTWNSSNTSIATVSNTGVVTGKADGIATITVTSADDTTKTASCTVTVSEESDWSELAEMAKVIANDSTINSGSSQATVTVGGESKTIKVGDIYKVKHNGVIRRVRVLGFKHDDLVNPAVYGGNNSKAGISFEFYDCIGKHNMNGTSESDSTNANGWAATEMRTYLEGEEGKGKLSNKDYIKQVKKKYIKTFSDASSVATSNDYLWLLACSEIVNSGYQTGYYGYAITSEGSQYKYYQGVTAPWDESSTNRTKYVNGIPCFWWLRSPYYSNTTGFCQVSSDGRVYVSYFSSNENSVAPGFSI